MGRYKALSLTARKRELTNLIKDGEKLSFSDDLLNDYKKQLLGVEEEIKKDKDRRKKFNTKKEK